MSSRNIGLYLYPLDEEANITHFLVDPTVTHLAQIPNFDPES
jgi:hypothetical protein